MLDRRMLAVAAGAATAIILGSVSPLTATAAPAADKDNPRHERAVGYWTAERIANARPMELLRVDPTTGKIQPQGKGGCKGKDCSTGDGSNTDDSGSTGSGDGTDSTTELATTSSQEWQSSQYAGTDADVAPLTGKVLFTLGAYDYVCSASVVADEQNEDGEALLLTAGHCVQDAGAGWATNWTFFPDYGRSGDNRSVDDCTTAVLGCWTADRFITSSAWAERSDFNYDFAFAVVGPGGHDGLGLEEALAAAAGHNGAVPAAVGFDRPRGEFLASFGYPQGAPYDGQDLIYCAGDAKAWDRFNRRLLNSYDQGLSCAMTGGSSGGPWYAEFATDEGRGIATSVNSFKYVNDDTTMYGPYFGSYAAAAYQAARSADVGGSHVTVAPTSSLP